MTDNRPFSQVVVGVVVAMAVGLGLLLALALWMFSTQLDDLDQSIHDENNRRAAEHRQLETQLDASDDKLALLVDIHQVNQPPP